MSMPESVIMIDAPNRMTGRIRRAADRPNGLSRGVCYRVMADAGRQGGSRRVTDLVWMRLLIVFGKITARFYAPRAGREPSRPSGSPTHPRSRGAGKPTGATGPRLGMSGLIVKREYADSTDGYSR
jgi:hypothetical protein